MSTEIPTPEFSNKSAISPEIQERANQLMDGLRNDRFDDQRRAHRRWAMLTDSWKASDLLDDAHGLNQNSAVENTGANAEAVTYVQAAMDYEDRKKADQLTDEEKARDLAMTTLYPEGEASIAQAEEEGMLRRSTPEMIAYHEHESGKKVFDSEADFRARIEELRALQAQLNEQE